MESAPARHMTFLHGLGGTPLTWEDQVAKLPPALPATAPWLRGLRPGAHDEFALADAAADVLMARQLDGVTGGALVGVGLGAMVAMQCALQDPDSVTHLVLVSPQVKPTKGAMRAQRMAARLTPSGVFARRGVSKHQLVAALGETDRFDADGTPDQVACPTLVVCGATDRAGVTAGRLLAAQIPDARLEVLDGVGADVPHQAAAQLNDLLYPFCGHAPRP